MALPAKAASVTVRLTAPAGAPRGTADRGDTYSQGPSRPTCTHSQITCSNCASTHMFEAWTFCATRAAREESIGDEELASIERSDLLSMFGPSQFAQIIDVASRIQ